MISEDKIKQSANSRAVIACDRELENLHKEAFSIRLKIKSIEKTRENLLKIHEIPNNL